ncbi:MAG: ABC transporter permease subunit, partial [Candidatus Eisenbacteria bacterium]|nr:ABC transporter permease subunit [Candidatus Latescibacterota bacterium]MBD3302955.1 ABC transporter permease subunit [Candidatus Eisenbacteria bacterium]
MSPSRTVRLALREVRSFLSSPVGWIILSVFFFVAGLVFVGLLGRYRLAALSMAQNPQLRAGEAGLHVSDWVVRPYLYNLGSVLLFFIPVLTMRSFAEERRGGSLELLLSYPLRGSEIVLGKFLGAVFALLLLLLVLPVHGLVLSWVSPADWTAALAGSLGMLLLGLFMLSLGLLISSLSQSQVEAAVLTLGILLLLGLGPGVAEAASPALARILSFV